MHVNTYAYCLTMCSPAAWSQSIMKSFSHPARPFLRRQRRWRRRLTSKNPCSLILGRASKLADTTKGLKHFCNSKLLWPAMTWSRELLDDTVRLPEWMCELGTNGEFMRFHAERNFLPNERWCCDCFARLFRRPFTPPFTSRDRKRLSERITDRDSSLVSSFHH